jgi:pimeloyl-ACP methyl ester carboxylesterase
MSMVTSRDGTAIAFDRAGQGPAVILVGGGLADRMENAPLAPELARTFTVYNHGRRGRGESRDTPPYALDREIEDLDALIAEAGGSAHLFGVSSGGALALEAAAGGLAIDRIAVYEVPYSVADDAVERWRAYSPKLAATLAGGLRGEALELFMQLAGASDQDIASARSSSMWSDLESIADTLAYDAACLGDGLPPTARLARVTQPTLVATGASLDPHSRGLAADFYQLAADAIASSLPHAVRQTIATQSHVADPRAIVPVLVRFFRD